MDHGLDRFMHLYALNRGVLMTPFHNMALMSPGDDGRRRRPPHSGIRRGGRRARRLTTFTDGTCETAALGVASFLGRKGNQREGS